MKRKGRGLWSSLAKRRNSIQLYATFLTNIHLPNFLQGVLYYITGLLIFFGIMLGRFICGFLCPFGWFQDLLHKIPTKKFSTKKLKVLRYLKYGVLLITVVALPILLTNNAGIGSPYFCKYICPQGILEGGIPLSLVDKTIRATLGTLFTLKFTILMAVIILSVLFYRPFCKWLCPFIS